MTCPDATGGGQERHPRGAVAAPATARVPQPCRRRAHTYLKGGRRAGTARPQPLSTMRFAPPFFPGCACGYLPRPQELRPAREPTCRHIDAGQREEVSKWRPWYRHSTRSPQDLAPLRRRRSNRVQALTPAASSFHFRAQTLHRTTGIHPRQPGHFPEPVAPACAHALLAMSVRFCSCRPGTSSLRSSSSYVRRASSARLRTAAQ